MKRRDNKRRKARRGERRVVNVRTAIGFPDSEVNLEILAAYRIIDQLWIKLIKLNLFLIVCLLLFVVSFLMMPLSFWILQPILIIGLLWRLWVLFLRVRPTKVRRASL